MLSTLKNWLRSWRRGYNIVKIEASNICSQSKPTCRLSHTHMLVRKDSAEWVKKPWGGSQKLCERRVPCRRGNVHIYSTYPLSAYTPGDAWAVECACSPPANNCSCQYTISLLQGAFFSTYHNSHWMFGFSRVRKTPGPIKPFLFHLPFLFWLFLCILIYFLYPPAWYMAIIQLNFYPKTIIILLYCNSGICL